MTGFDPSKINLDDLDTFDELCDEDDDLDALDEEEEDTRPAPPSAAGGKATVERHGPGYMHEIASKGGRTTVERYGPERLRELGRKGGKRRAQVRKASRKQAEAKQAKKVAEGRGKFYKCGKCGELGHNARTCGRPKLADTQTTTDEKKGDE
jgi:general stress protein YciG